MTTTNQTFVPALAGEVESRPTNHTFAPWFWRALSVFLLLSAALLTPIALGVVLTSDEEIRSRSTINMILAARILMSLTGVWLFIRPPRWVPLAAVRVVGLVAAASLAGQLLGQRLAA